MHITTLYNIQKFSALLSYAFLKQDCSISIICGTTSIEFNFNIINTPGDGNNIPIADPIPETISATPGGK